MKRNSFGGAPFVFCENICYTGLHKSRNGGEMMQDQKTAGQAEDWVLSEAYYKEDTGKKELRLEDFLEEETAEGQSGLADGSSLTEQLEAMAAQVKQIRELSGTGHPADQIASMLGMDGQQVRDILVCMQSFPEDDPLAVARLIVLG